MFFLTYILQYIFSLSKKTRTHVPFLILFVVSLWQQIGSGQTRCGNLKKIAYCWWSSTWENLRATASLTCRIHTMAAVGVAKKNQTDKQLYCYNGHLEQPHSRAVSISSEYEVPSLQRKTTFLRLLLVMPQQTPGGAEAWQDLGQSMRGILLVDVHVLKAWWRFSCSLTISPWHVSSVSQVGPVYLGWQWQTGSPSSDTRHSPRPQRCPLQAGGSCRRSQYWPW